MPGVHLSPSFEGGIWGQMQRRFTGSQSSPLPQSALVAHVLLQYGEGCSASVMHSRPGQTLLFGQGCPSGRQSTSGAGHASSAQMPLATQSFGQSGSLSRSGQAVVHWPFWPQTQSRSTLGQPVAQRPSSPQVGCSLSLSHCCTKLWYASTRVSAPSVQVWLVVKLCTPTTRSTPSLKVWKVGPPESPWQMPWVPFPMRMSVGYTCVRVRFTVRLMPPPVPEGLLMP
jgi:hypothetical protein